MQALVHAPDALGDPAEPGTVPPVLSPEPEGRVVGREPLKLVSPIP
jgi:hypothetical protein